MTRTVLYYPTISVPDGLWLRQALLYYDEIASIFPLKVDWEGNVLGDLIELSPETAFLKEEGVFRPISPEFLTIRNPDNFEPAFDLQERLRRAVEHPMFEAHRTRDFVRVHRGKVNAMILSFLEDSGLARPDKKDEAWLLVEKRCALLYMSMLAELLADLEQENTVPATDKETYRDLMHRGQQDQHESVCIQIFLQRVLPVPRPKVPLQDILTFKRNNEAHLLRYRRRIATLCDELRAAADRNAAQECVTRFAEGQRAEVTDLANSLRDANIATWFGSLRALVGTNSPTFWLAILREEQLQRFSPQR